MNNKINQLLIGFCLSFNWSSVNDGRFADNYYCYLGVCSLLPPPPLMTTLSLPLIILCCSIPTYYWTFMNSVFKVFIICWYDYCYKNILFFEYKYLFSRDSQTLFKLSNFLFFSLSFLLCHLQVYFENWLFINYLLVHLRNLI